MQTNFTPAIPMAPVASAGASAFSHSSLRSQFRTCPTFGAAVPAYPAAQPDHLPRSLITRDKPHNQAPAAPAAFTPPLHLWHISMKGTSYIRLSGALISGPQFIHYRQTHPSLRSQFPTNPTFGAAGPAYPVAQPTYLPRSPITRDTSCSRVPAANV